ncbi:MAG: AAA family ATPase [Armatimonadetes bacterium]|nr:AAA family ATPase [Armatimonadota bacterium]
MKRKLVIEYTPPISLETEQELLGTILLYGDQYFLTEMMGITAEHFSYKPHQFIWRAISLAAKTNRPITVPQVFEIMQIQGWSNELGEGEKYLIKLTEMAVAPDRILTLTNILHRCRHANRVMEQCIRTLSSYSVDGDWENALSNLLSAITSQSSPISTPIAYPPSEILTMELSFPFIIDHFLPEVGILLIAGSAGVGKSLFALWLGIKIAAGEPLFQQFNTQPSTVLYVDGESSPAGYKRRLSLLTSNPPENIFYTQWANNLLSPEGKAQLEFLIRTYNPSTIILDSMIRFHNLNENDPTAMKSFYNTLNWFRSNYGTAFIILQHARKTSLFGSTIDAIRGSTEIVAFPDTVLFLRRPQKSNTLTIDIVKLRHSELDFTKFRIALNRSSTPWFYEFLGSSEEVESRIEEAIKFVTDLLEGGEMSRAEIVEKGKAQGFSRVAIDRALSNLRADGTVITIKRGRNSFYQLASSNPQLDL